MSRLASLTNALTDANDLSVTFAYNPASQIASNVRTGDMYAWTGHGNGSTAFVQNGLNQQTSIGGVTATWDTKGNLTSEPQSGKTYGYSSENLLKTASGGVTLAYDPALRLYQTVSGAATTRFLYDGVDAIAEYDGANALLRRFVFDPTTGQPVVWYEGTGTLATNRRYLSQDERGSVISVSGSTGSLIGSVPNTYDEYGKPGASNLGRYQYTGQMYVPEVGEHWYKSRFNAHRHGIFNQPDRIGYDSGPNWYVYVGDDPINWKDPTGEFWFLVGAAGGALISYGAQVAQNYANGQTGSAAWTNVNPGLILVGAATGALGGAGLLTAGLTGTARIIPVVGTAIRLNAYERGAAIALGSVGFGTRSYVSHKTGTGVGALLWHSWDAGMSLFYPTPPTLINQGGLDTYGIGFNLLPNGDYAVDENGNIVDAVTGELILDENGNPIPAPPKKK